MYVEARLGTQSEDVLAVGRRVVSGTVLPNVGSENDYTREVIEGLLETSTWLMNNIATKSTVQREDFLQRIMVNAQGEVYLIEAIRAVVESDNDLEKMEAFKNQNLVDLDTHQKTTEVDAIISQARRQLAFEKSKIDWSRFVRDLMEKLEPYQRDGSAGGLDDLGVLERINVDDIDGAIETLTEDDGEEEGSQYAFRFGWQGVNRMFGDALGLRRKEVLCVSALSHNFKSGLTLNMFRQAAMYNTPMPSAEGRKPMLLHISYEQPVQENYKLVYSQMKLTETGERVDMKKLNIAEVTAYVKERLQVNGWTVEFVRVDPDNSNYRKLFGLIEYYEKLGYEIYLCAIDYLGKLNREGCGNGGPFGADIKNLYSRVLTFMQTHRIACITAHQMSTKAAELERMGITDQLVNEVAGKGYYDGCSNLQTELDVELYCKIVEGPNGSYYLCMRRGKHRTSAITPHKDLYTCYRMADNLAPGFADDIHGVDRSMRKMGDDANDNSGGYEFM